MAANLVLVDFSVDQPNLWAVELNTFSLVQGTNEYTLPDNVLMVLDCFIRTTNNGVQNDRILWDVSRSEYASYPNKLQQAFPTVFWADRTAPVKYTLYPTPDGNGPYTLCYYAVIQDQDAQVTGATQLSTPYRMLSAFADAIAAKLALSYPPPPPMTADALDKVAQRSYSRARAQENENSVLYVTPGLSGYFV